MAVSVTAIAAFAGLMICGCKPSPKDAGSLHFVQTISPLPVRVGHSQLHLTITRPDGTPLRHAKIQVEADMTHAGMTPSFSDAVEVGVGMYQAPIDLEMAGDWVLLLHVQAADGSKAEHQIDLHGIEAK